MRFLIKRVEYTGDEPPCAGAVAIGDESDYWRWAIDVADLAGLLALREAAGHNLIVSTERVGGDVVPAITIYDGFIE